MKKEPAKEAAPDEAEAGADLPHALQLTAWDVPSAIGAGEHFRAAVGARCSAGCDLGGRELILFDHEGAPAATVKLGREVWPGTEALYFALKPGPHSKLAAISGRRRSPAGMRSCRIRRVRSPWPFASSALPSAKSL